MKTLNYETLNEIGYDGYLLKDAPERVLQFGEGNFLRAFVDYFIDMLSQNWIQLQSRTLSADRAGSCRQDQRTGGTLHTSICADFRMVRKSTSSGSLPVSPDA